MSYLGGHVFTDYHKVVVHPDSIKVLVYCVRNGIK